MKQCKKYIFLVWLTVVAAVNARNPHAYVSITPACAQAVNMLFAAANRVSHCIIVEGNSRILAQDAESLMQGALDLLDTMEPFTHKEEITKTLRAYYHDIENGLYTVQAADVAKKRCKVVDSLCVKNLLSVAANAQIGRQLVAGCVSASEVTTNTATSESLRAFLVDAQVINATSIFVDEINGLPISPSGLSVVGPRGQTGPQGVTGNTGTTGNTGAGSLGALGAIGAVGNSGAQGITGNTGPQGLPGNTGPDGGFSGSPAGYVSRFNNASAPVLGVGGFGPVTFASSAIADNGWTTADNITFTCQVAGLYEVSFTGNFILPSVNELIRVGMRILTNVGDNQAYYGRINEAAPIPGGVSFFLANSALINCVVGTTVRIDVTASVAGVILCNPALQSSVNTQGQAASLIIRRVF